MAEEIHKVSVRKRLAIRNEPHWGAPLGTGRHIGVRKARNGTCKWVARFRADDGTYSYQALGQVTDDLDYTEAKKAAEAWFADLDVGIVSKKAVTVREACKDYVEELEGEDRKDTAHDAKKRFERTIYKHPIADIRLSKLRTKTIKAWRDNLGGAKSSQNRNLSALNAALNMAVRHHKVNASVAQQWKAVGMHKKATGKRTLFLDIKQRRALLEAAEGAVKDLILAAMLTGARPGELTKMKRSQYDSRTKSATFIGKTGPRTVPLSPAAVELFDRLSKDKLPAAFLLTRDDGKEWAHSDWDELVREAAKKAELPKGTVLYTLRHSAITEMLLGGMPTLEAAKLTGTSLAMIEMTYGHLATGAARERLAGVQMI